VFTGSTVPGRSGRPAFCISSRAVALSPTFSITSGFGPMKVIPSSAQISAKYGSSERKPYPGWIASAPVLSAAPMMLGMWL
jgi:hypothetical protein